MDSCTELNDASTPHRTLWTIVRTCLATIFACTWVAVHPNIPGPTHGTTRTLCTRLGIMIMVLLAPEMVITWASRQYIAAREIQTKICGTYEPGWYKRVRRFFRVHSNHSAKAQGEAENGGKPELDDQSRVKEWTIVHSFFLLMGGFVFYDQESDCVKTLDTKKTIELRKQGKIRWPPVTEADLKDKSKGDFFSKGDIVLQITWFIVQCIVRAWQRMTLTQLEIATLAYAPLTLALYLLWWDKPLGVRYPVVVELVDVREAQSTFDDGQVTCSTSSQKKPARMIEYDSVTWTDSIIDIILCVNPFDDEWQEVGFLKKVKKVFLCLFVLPFAVAPIALALFVFAIWSIIRPVVSMSTEIKPKGDRVPTFYAPTITSFYLGMYCDYACPALVGLIFGDIHAFAWSASFPTTFEKWAWRAATITIATFFVWRICSLLVKLLEMSEKRPDGFDFGRLSEILGGVLNLCLVVFIGTVFVPARVALLVLPFTSLRSLPDGAFQDIDWTSFVPHI